LHLYDVDKSSKQKRNLWQIYISCLCFDLKIISYLEAGEVFKLFLSVKQSEKMRDFAFVVERFEFALRLCFAF